MIKFEKWLKGKGVDNFDKLLEYSKTGWMLEYLHIQKRKVFINSQIENKKINEILYKFIGE